MIHCLIGTIDIEAAAGEDFPLCLQVQLYSSTYRLAAALTLAIDQNEGGRLSNLDVIDYLVGARPALPGRQ